MAATLAVPVLAIFYASAAASPGVRLRKRIQLLNMAGEGSRHRAHSPNISTRPAGTPGTQRVSPSEFKTAATRHVGADPRRSDL